MSRHVQVWPKSVDEDDIVASLKRMKADGTLTFKGKGEEGAALCRLLHKEAGRARPLTVAFLLDNGVDPDGHCDESGRTALLSVCSRNLHFDATALDVVRLLLGKRSGVTSSRTRRANVNARDKDGATALHLLALAAKRRPVTDAMRLLVDAGADVNAPGAYRTCFRRTPTTPLGWAEHHLRELTAYEYACQMSLIGELWALGARDEPESTWVRPPSPRDEASENSRRRARRLRSTKRIMRERNNNKEKEDYTESLRDRFEQMKRARARAARGSASPAETSGTSSVPSTTLSTLSCSSLSYS